MTTQCSKTLYKTDLQTWRNIGIQTDFGLEHVTIADAAHIFDLSPRQIYSLRRRWMESQDWTPTARPVCERKRYAGRLDGLDDQLVGLCSVRLGTGLGKTFCCFLDLDMCGRATRVC